MARQSASIFSRDIALAAVRASFPKLDPRSQVRNPVMFIVELGSVITTVIFILDLARGHTGQLWFVAVIAVWLWLTVLFANFAEAIAEGRGKAQANALRATRTTTLARLQDPALGHLLAELHVLAHHRLALGRAQRLHTGLVGADQKDVSHGSSS